MYYFVVLVRVAKQTGTTCIYIYTYILYRYVCNLPGMYMELNAVCDEMKGFYCFFPYRIEQAFETM